MSHQQAAEALSDTSFESLDLKSEVRQGIRDAGFKYCTPIQALTLPVALKGTDVAGQAQTGTGKTAAFLLAIFDRLLKNPNSGSKDQPRSLILAPTRELAIQIHKDAELLGKHCGLKFGLAYGGIDYEKQRKTLEGGVDILMGTPGRLIDYFKQGVFNLKHIDVMVLDEADRMFDLGFIKDIRYLLRRLPPRDKRQCLMFSATLSHRVLELAYEHMNEPELLKVEDTRVTAEHVEQSVFYPANEEKLPLLIKMLREIDNGRVMIFANTRDATDTVNRTLNANGLHAAALSGRVPQKKRQTLLRRFHDGEIAHLVATDVAARGLHIPDVTHVFNFDLPQDAPDYVHRIGRTARLGAKGHAITFACENYAFHLPEIEEYIGYAIPLSQDDVQPLPEIEIPPRPPRRPRGGKPHGKPRNHSKGKPNNRRRRRRKPNKSGNKQQS